LSFIRCANGEFVPEQPLKMRFSIAAIVALAAGAFAHSHSSAASPTEAYTTEVVTSYTTFCPVATTLTFSGTTYVVSTPTTLTLTGSSYTVTRPLLSSTITICNACASGTAPTAVSSTIPTVSPVYTGSTIAVTSTTTGPAPLFTGGANRMAGAGATLAGLAGVAAFLL